MLIESVGIFLGVIARVFFPWIRKLKQGKVKGFDVKYVYSAIGSVIFGVIVTLLVFPSFQGAGSAGSTLESFAIAFGFGFGWHSIVNEAGKWGGAFG